MPTPRVRLKVDWNLNGDFWDANEDVSADMLSCSGVRGRDYASTLEASSTAGKLRAVLNNFDGKYSPNNSSGPLFGNLLSNRPVLLTHEPPLGYYGNFNGTSSRISFGTTPANPFAGVGTIEALIRPFTITSSDRIIAKRVIGTAGWLFYLSAGSNGFAKLNFFVEFTGTDGRWITNAIVPFNQFSRVAVVYDSDGTGDPTLYVKSSDGNIQTLTVGNGLERVTTPVGTYQSDAAVNLTVGSITPVGGWFTGDIDDVRIWGDGRTEAEIDQNAFIEVAVASTGLLFYPKLNEESGTAVADATGNESDGVATAVDWQNDHIWHGFIHDIVPVPAQRGRKLAILEAFGALAQFTEENVEMPMATSIATGDVIDDILDELGWPAGDRDVDTGIGTLARHWSPSTPALAALRAVEKSENGFLVEDRDGKIRFESRHRRLLTPHTVSQATFDDAIASALTYRKPELHNPRQFIRNSFTIDVRQYTIVSLAVLWALSETGVDSPLLAPGEARTFKSAYPVADSQSQDVGVDAWTTPVESTDWIANTQSDGGGTDGSADVDITGVIKRGNSMTWVLTNNGAVALFLTTIQARGTPVSESDAIGLISEDAASITKYKKRSFNLDDHFISSSQDGQDWCDFNVSIFAKEIPIVDFEVWANTSAFHLLNTTRLDVSDRITFKATTLATQLGIDEDCFIETIRFTLGEDHILKTRYSVAPSSGYSNFWILGTSELDTETILAF